MNKQHCDYCGGDTFDDTRGNCAACGVPKKKNQEQSEGFTIVNLLQSCGRGQLPGTYSPPTVSTTQWAQDFIILK